MLGLLLMGPALAAAVPARPVLAHAHNDYEHARPLLDALALDFDSVEADIHLVDGRLLVAHDRKQVRPDRTLESLYLEPLAACVRKNGGWVRAPGRPLLLLIDVKTDAAPTCRALHAVLARHAFMLTTWTEHGLVPRAVTVVVSGNRSAEIIAAESPRYESLDGRADELESAAPATLMPQLSIDWKKISSWRGEGAMPAAERGKLDDVVARAHARGRRLRFWNTPDRPGFWRVLSVAGVDIVGADDLAALRAFLDSPQG